MTAGLTEPVHRAIATRLRRGQTPDQLISVGHRTDWWTEDDVDWVVLGNDGPRPEGWTLSVADNQTPTEGAAPEAPADDTAGTAPGTFDPGHGNAGPDAQPQVSPSRSQSGEGEGPGASDAPAGPPTAGSKRDCVQCGQSFKGKRADSNYCSQACVQKAYRDRKKTATEEAERSAPRAPGPDILALGLAHPSRRVRNAAARAQAAIDDLCTELGSARAS